MILAELIAEIKHNYNETYGVFFDFGGFFPNGMESYRGHYDQLAITFDLEGQPMYAKDFLKMLEESVGKTFDGYKGGGYRMSAFTPLWVSNYGICSGTSVKGVIDTGSSLIIETGYCQD